MKSLLNQEWFTNPVNLVQYKLCYIKHLSKTGKTEAIVNRFDSVDCVELNAISELVELSRSQVTALFKKEVPPAWICDALISKKDRVLYKSKLLELVKEERRIYHSCYHQNKLKALLGVSSSTIWRWRRGDIQASSDYEPILKSMIIAPISGNVMYKRAVVDKVLGND